MLVRMLIAERVATNGRDVHWRKEGEILDLPESLASSLVRGRIASAELNPQSETKEDLPLAYQPKSEMKASKKRQYRANKF